MFRPLFRPSGWLGITAVAVLAALANGLAQTPFAAKLGLSPLTWAILLGIFFGNTIFPVWNHLCSDGVDFSKNILLRAGIILYGFRITLQQVFAVGWTGIGADCFVIATIFSLAILVGRWLRMDRDTVILIGAGSGICGAAAVMATEPVLKASPAKVSVAVATVVLFGTMSMFGYPYLKEPLGLSNSAYGLLVGSTVHEVAQAVAAGRAISQESESVAVIVKMLRVMMLAPFLMVVSLIWGRSSQTSSHSNPLNSQAIQPSSLSNTLKQINVPWFAVAFLLVTCLYSSGLVPQRAVGWLVTVDTVFLTMAMSALGLRTRTSALRAAGPRPMLLAGLLFILLVSEGLMLTKLFSA